MVFIHKELALIRNSSEEATRKYVNRLLYNLFKRVGDKLNINYKELYENFKKQDKRANTKNFN